MGRPLVDLSGKTLGRLYVVGRIGGIPVRWLCKCSCGRFTRPFSMGLKNGTTKSCGCLSSEQVKKRATKHGQHDSPEYESWSQAKYRCHNPENQAYRNYGARGIKMCAQWRESFPAFLEDIGRRPTPKHTLERIDNSIGYEPGNCRWALMHDQSRNTRVNRVVEFDGRRQVLMDWSKELGIHYETLRGRLNRWRSVERAFTQPVAR